MEKIGWGTAVCGVKMTLKTNIEIVMANDVPRCSACVDWVAKDVVTSFEALLA